MSRKLIINADDFGISKATNKAIKELLLSKKITSVSLLSVADEAEEALAIAKELGISVGAHLTLNSDFSFNPWKAMISGTTLCDSAGFLLTDTKLLAQIAKGKDVTKECVAQIEYILNFGVKIDHIDNHSGTMYGINMRLFFINAFKLARKYNLPFRFPKGNGFLNDYFKEVVPSIVKVAYKAIVLTGRVMRVKLLDEMITNPYRICDIPDYNVLEYYYLNAIRNIKEGVSELFLHPSYYCPEISPYDEEWKKREYELEFLNSPALEKTLTDEGIELISYADLVAR